MTELPPSPEALHLVLHVTLLGSDFSHQEPAKLQEAFIMLSLPACLAFSEGLDDLGENLKTVTRVSFP